MGPTKSIILKYCWCCGPGVTSGLHDHHVIPQTYGGTNGPQVTICATCHTLIHSTALKPQGQWPQHILPTFETRRQACLLQLTQIIWQARNTTRHLDRPMQMQLKFTMERSTRIRELKKLLGVSSLTDVIDVCVDRVYSQLTPLKK